MLGISYVAEQLAASQEEFSCLELVSYTLDRGWVERNLSGRCGEENSFPLMGIEPGLFAIQSELSYSQINSKTYR
jgi:hypothetical protein